jgi:hypothetical protein
MFKRNFLLQLEWSLRFNMPYRRHIYVIKYPFRLFSVKSRREEKRCHISLAHPNLLIISTLPVKKRNEPRCL